MTPANPRVYTEKVWHSLHLAQIRLGRSLHEDGRNQTVLPAGGELRAGGGERGGWTLLHPAPHRHPGYIRPRPPSWSRTPGVEAMEVELGQVQAIHRAASVESLRCQFFLDVLRFSLW